MHERSERVESPGTYLTMSFTWPFLLGSVLSDCPPMLGWLSHGEGRDAIT